MSGSFESLFGVFGGLLGGIAIAVAMVLAGISPLLGVLAAAVVVLDVVYYHRQSRSTSSTPCGSS